MILGIALGTAALALIAAFVLAVIALIQGPTSTRFVAASVILLIVATALGGLHI